MSKGTLLYPTPFILGLPGDTIMTGSVGPGVAVWPSASRAIYVPLRITTTQRLKSVAVWCTATGSSTYDLGLYDVGPAERLASSGSQSLVAASVNTWTLTNPILLEAGHRYYIGMAAGSTSASFARYNPSVNQMRMGGYAQEAAALPLPATATPAQSASGYVPMLALTFV